MRILLEATFDGGSVAQIFPTMDLSVMRWTEFFAPLAALVHAAHPDAVWTATPIPDDVSDKGALLGY